VHSLQKVTEALSQSWSYDTSSCKSEWSTDNPARGQCAVTALVIQDYFSGEIIKYSVVLPQGTEGHFCNFLPNGNEYDATKIQYSTTTAEFAPKEVDLRQFANVREKLLADDDTRRRYEILKSKVTQKLNN
jgi:hypothetical protein